jgi:hypothetical protein
MGVAATMQEWWSNRKAMQAYVALTREEREALARDAGVPEDRLHDIVCRGPRAGQGLDRLLRMIDLDPAQVTRCYPDVMRDLQVTCSTCALARKCRRDLDRGMSRLVLRTYCPNAGTIKSLGGRASGQRQARI